MTEDGWAHSAGRHNPYAGVREQELHEALNANPYSITEAKDAWVAGADELKELARDLGEQKANIRAAYKGAGEDAAQVFAKMEKMVLAREREMRNVADALTVSHDAVTTARTAYYALPPVRPPSDGSLPAALPMGATKRQLAKHAEKVEARKQANATADAEHEADKRAAEAKAVEALSVLNTSLNSSADKMRDVAGMPKPEAPPSPDANVPAGHVLAKSPAPASQVIGTPTVDVTPGPTTQPPIVTNPGDPDPVDTGNLPTGTPSTTTPSTPSGVLAGPVVESTHPQATPAPLGTPAPGTTPLTSPVSTVAGPGVAAVAPTGLASSAIRRPTTPLPGTTPARGATLGRSGTAAPARGALGRNAMVPGQAAGRANGVGRGARMAAGQGGSGTRGRAGSRGSMVPGTGGGRRKGRDREDEPVELLWDDGDDWLGEDETAPPVLN